MARMASIATDPAEQEMMKELYEKAIRYFEGLTPYQKRLYYFAQKISFVYGNLPEGNTRTKEDVALTVLRIAHAVHLWEDPENQKILLGT
jgi:hypothetical protein